MARASSSSAFGTNRPQRIEAFLREAEAFLTSRGWHEGSRNASALPALAYHHGLTRREYEEALERLYAAPPPSPSQQSATSSSSPPLPPPPPRPAADVAADEEVISAQVVDQDEAEFPQIRPADLATFVRQARLILATERGWSERALSQVNLLADQLLIPYDLRQNLYRRLRDPSFNPEPPSAPLVVAEADRPLVPDVADEPGAKPHKRRRRSPSRKYVHYLKKAMAALPSQRINQRREKKLIQEGITKLGLSEVLARDLLLEVAERKGYQVVSQSANPNEEDQHEAHEELVTTFQQRAAAVIAGQGGVNSLTRIIINQVATELGLSDQERDAALASIQKQSETTSDDARQQQRADAFRQFLKGKLEAIDHGIVIPTLAQKLVRLGVDMHGLTDEVAWGTLREAVQEEELHLVTVDQARAHIATLVDELLSDDGFLSTEHRARLMSEGQQWGLAPQACQQLIEDRVLDHERRRRRDQRQVALVFTMLFLVLLVGGGYAIYLGTSSPGLAPALPPDPLVESPTEEETVSQQSTNPTPEAPKWQRQPWWSEPLALELLKLYQSEPALQKPLTAICTSDEERRIRGYRALLPQLVTMAVSRTGAPRDSLHEIVAGLVRDDPSDTAVEAIARMLTDDLSFDDKPLTAATPLSSILERAYLAAYAAEQPDLPENRQAMLLDKLAAELGVSYSGSAPPMELTMNEMIRGQYRLISQLAGTNANVAAELHASLSARAGNYLPVDQVIAKDADLTAQIVSRMTTNWDIYRDVVQRIVSSQKAERLLPLLDVFEQSFESLPIQQEVAVLLSRRIGRSVDAENPTQATALVRAKLGLDAAVVRDGEMYRIFSRRAAAWSWQVPEDVPPADAAQEIAELAYVSVLGHAAAQGDLGKRVFEDVLQQEAPTLSPTSPTASSGPPFTEAITRIETIINRLRRGNDPELRINQYRELTRLAGETNDMDYDTSLRLIEYIIAPKPRAEQTRVISGLRAFSHWTQIKLALADQLEDARRAPSDLQEVVSGLVGETIVISDAQAARDELRETLLHYALEGLPQEQAERGVLTPAMANELAQTLSELYRRHATLAGLSAEQSAGGELPDAVMKQLIDLERERLESMRLSDENTAALQEIIRREVALDYLSNSPIATLAARQRIWLRLLALRIGIEQPRLEGQLRHLVETLENNHAEAGSLLVQLRSGELALIRLWELAGGSA